MKTIVNTLIAIVILFLNNESFSNVKKLDDHTKGNKYSYIPVSPRDWSDNELEVPENLKFIKAKYALVPVAQFVWGNPNEDAPTELAKDKRNMYIPVQAKVWDESEPEVPESLGFIKAKLALVPVPAKVWNELAISEEEITELK